jgi:hypothetical protein
MWGVCVSLPKKLKYFSINKEKTIPNRTSKQAKQTLKMSQTVVAKKPAVVRKIKIKETSPLNELAKKTSAAAAVASTICITTSSPSQVELEIHVKNIKNLVQLTNANAKHHIGDDVLFESRKQWNQKEILGLTKTGIKIEHADLKNMLQLVSRVAYVIPKKNVAVKVAVEVAEKKQSVWLSIRTRTPPAKRTLPIVWENIEDISDDEEDTPQKAGKRLSDMKDSKERMHRRIYEIKMDELQYAGLFLNWAPVKPMPFRMEW